MRLWPILVSLFLSLPVFADVSVTASVDQAQVPFGQTVMFTTTVQGAQMSSPPSVPQVEGLQIQYVGHNIQLVMGDSNSQSIAFNYQIVPTRVGQYTIPSVEVVVGGKTYRTEPVTLTVAQGITPPDVEQLFFLRYQINRQQVYLGETVPLHVLLFTRVDQDVRGLGNFSFEAEGLGYRFLQNPKSARQVINGETFNVYVIEGAISPTRTGSLAFGPCALKVQVAVPRRRRVDDFIENFLGRVETREVLLTSPEIPVEVVALPADGKPADFTGAIGQWNIEVDAKPTEINVGDPITLTMKITGAGNIDTVATPPLTGLEHFKTYDPTSKTSKNELSTTGERIFQQVLVPKTTDATELPAVRLSYFDPVANAYRSVERGPIKLVVNAGQDGALVTGAARVRPSEKLGEDIVYLKGELGPAESNVSWPAFWFLNIAPVIALTGGIVWKRRRDRLRADIAYARRSRAAKQARKQLAAAATVDETQRALQNYLGDRLNIPASGITVSVVGEHDLPCEIAGVFEACDAARFAGARADLDGLKQTVEQVIDDLERADR